MVADRYLACVSTRSKDKVVKNLGIDGLSKSHISRMAAALDKHATAFRHRPLDETGPFRFVAADAVTMPVREEDRIVDAVSLTVTSPSPANQPQASHDETYMRFIEPSRAVARSCTCRDASGRLLRHRPELRLRAHGRPSGQDREQRY